MSTRARAIGILGAAALAGATLAAAAPAAAGPPDQPPVPDREQVATLTGYAQDTWESFVAMTDEDTGIPADNISGDLDPATRSGYTSPTNIGAYLWSTVVARDLKFITRAEALDRLSQTLESVAQLERHEESGMFYNWYDEATLEKLYAWPGTGDRVYPFLSSVDNGWLATALVLVANAEPRLAAQAEAISSTMDFGFYYDPNARPDVGSGLLRGGFWDEPPADPAAVPGNYRDPDGTLVWFTGHHYGTLNTEPRIASYLGIAWDQIPEQHYFTMWRTFPSTCDWSWPEQRPVGFDAEYLGIPVFEGAYRYNGTQLVPTWGGSMFEALMVDLFVPEADWGPQSWGENHPLTVQAQIHHGMAEAGYGYWGFSPASNPFGGYREYGVDPIGMEPNGYASDEPRTFADPGWDDPACLRPPSWPESYNDGVVTPHASFLALAYERAAALTNLSNLRTDFDAYGPGGFYDSIAVRSGTVAERYLSLDQGMIMAAIGNELGNDRVKRYFVRGEVRQAIKPLLSLEEFNTSG